MIYTETLDDGTVKYIVRVKRYGKRKVLLRTANVNKAVSCAMMEYYEYLSGVWLYGKEQSKNVND